MIVFDYQHTCRSAHKAYIEHNSPFKSLKRKKLNGKGFIIPFLGEGYYFWEENINAAHDWGKRHCKGKYNIVQYRDLEIPRNILLDFGNRRDLAYFNELRNKYIVRRPESEKWSISVWIEFFKKIKLIDNLHFPYNYFRAEENYPEAEKNAIIKEKHIFASGEQYYTYLSPLWILCILEKNSMKFATKEIIY